MPTTDERIRRAGARLAQHVPRLSLAQLSETRTRLDRRRRRHRAMTAVFAIAVALIGFSVLAESFGVFDRSGQSRPAAEVLEPTTHGFMPEAVGFWDADHGMLVGRLSCDECRNGVVATTADGGRSWRIVREAAAPATQLSVAGAQSAWVVVGGELMATADAGVTWESIADNVEDAWMSSSTSGWAILGSANTGLVRTTDAGASWVEVQNPCSGETPDPQAIAFPEQEQGWVLCVAEPGAGQQRKHIYATTDAGSQWSQTDEGIGSSGYADDIWFDRSGEGWLLESIRGTPYVTDDGGASWTPKRGIASPDISVFYSVSFVDATTGYGLLYSRQAALMTTNDGGTTWSTVFRWVDSRG